MPEQIEKVGGWEIIWNPVDNTDAVVEARKDGSKVALLETDIEDRVVYSEKGHSRRKIEDIYAETRPEAYKRVGGFMHENDFYG